MSRVPSEIGAATDSALVGSATPRGADALGFGYVVVSALGFGAMAILARVAYADGVDVPTLLALRFSIAAAVMLGVLTTTRSAVARGSDLALLVLLGGLGYAGQAYAFFTALHYAPAGIVSLLLYTYPALVALLSALFLHETLARAKVMALLLASTGVALTVLPALHSAGSHEMPTRAVGVLLGLAAAAIYAVYIVAGARVTRRLPAISMATVVIASAAVVLTAIALVRGVHLPESASGWGAVLGIALASTVLAINLFFAGLARIGPTRASTLSTIEPVFTIGLAAAVLGERVEGVQLAGGALILVAVVLLARTPSSTP